MGKKVFNVHLGAYYTADVLVKASSKEEAIRYAETYLADTAKYEFADAMESDAWEEDIMYGEVYDAEDEGGDDVVSVYASNGNLYIFTRGEIEYNGVKYPIYVHEGGDIIATTELWDAMKNDDDLPKDSEAESLDDEIFYYASPDVFFDTTKMVEEYIHA